METARIRLQISASHSKQQLDKAIEAFCLARVKLGISPTKT